MNEFTKTILIAAIPALITSIGAYIIAAINEIVKNQSSSNSKLVNNAISNMLSGVIADLNKLTDLMKLKALAEEINKKNNE